jgi:HEAT repeat protein
MAWPFFFKPNVAKLRARRDVEGLIKCLQYREWGVRRDAVLALGAMGDVRAVRPLLATLNKDWSVEVQTRAVEALGRIKDPRAVPFLITGLESIIPTIKRKAAEALVELGAASVQALCVALQDLNSQVQEESAWALGEIRDRRAAPYLIAALADEKWEVRRGAAEALQKIDPDWSGSEAARRMIPHLIAALRDEETGKNAAGALARIGKAAVPALIQVLQELHPQAAQLAAWALGEIKDATAIDPLIIALTEREAALQRLAVEALSRTDPRWRHSEAARRALPRLLENLQVADPALRQRASRALMEIRDVRVVESLIKILREGNQDVRQEAAEILGKLTGKNFGRDAVRWQEWWKEVRSAHRSP